MTKIIGYDETKELLKKGLKLYHHNGIEINNMYLKDKRMISVRKDTFDKLQKENFLKMEKNDFDEFNFIEMYGVK